MGSEMCIRDSSNPDSAHIPPEGETKPKRANKSIDKAGGGPARLRAEPAAEHGGEAALAADVGGGGRSLPERPVRGSRHEAGDRERPSACPGGTNA